MGGRHVSDFTISFRDCQELQLLYSALLKLSVILDSCLEVIERNKDHCCKLDSWNATALRESSLREIEFCAAQMESHRRNARRLIEQCKGTRNLVCQKFSKLVTG